MHDVLFNELKLGFELLHENSKTLNERPKSGRRLRKCSDCCKTANERHWLGNCCPKCADCEQISAYFKAIFRRRTLCTSREINAERRQICS